MWHLHSQYQGTGFSELLEMRAKVILSTLEPGTELYWWALGVRAVPARKSGSKCLLRACPLLLSLTKSLDVLASRHTHHLIVFRLVAVWEVF